MPKRESDNRPVEATELVAPLCALLEEIRRIELDHASDERFARLLELGGRVNETLKRLGGARTLPEEVHPRVSTLPVSRINDSEPVVLIVESEPAASSFMRRVLELEGFDVVTACSLDEAQERAHETRPQVMTIDQLQLARGQDDWERRIASDPLLARIPVIIVQSPEQEVPMQPVGATDVVTKPIDPVRLVEVLRRRTGCASSTFLVVASTANDIASLVEAEGYRLVCADGVEEARDLLETMAPLGLIIDVHGVKGGIPFVEELRRQERRREMPILGVHFGLTELDRSRLEGSGVLLVGRSEQMSRELTAAILATTNDARQSVRSAG